MIYRVLQILLNFVTIFYCVVYGYNNNVSRKTDQSIKNLGVKNLIGGDSDGVVGIGLQICLKSVKIHKNKIIRTEDSREMGAKYINEIDLDSRKECLRLCCETEQCDVFVFEEKIPGSCYLFHCGSLDDFKCKFTNHANYTSAVITKNLNTKTTAELEEQIRRTQQDHELESLRKLADNNLAQEYSPRDIVTSLPVVTESSKIVLSTTTTTLPAKPACTRNQFECRTSGDCIAIYNACDGIPQCADGSDEASELGCPTDKPSIAPTIIGSKKDREENQQALTSQIGSLKYQQSMIDRRKPYETDYETSIRDKEPRVWKPVSNSGVVVVSPVEQERSQYIDRVNLQDNRGNQLINSQRYQWEYQPVYQQNNKQGNNYNSVNSIYREQNNGNNNIYEPVGEQRQQEQQKQQQQQSHIFNHKGPGVIGEDSEGGAYVDQNRQYAPYYPPDRGLGWQEGENLQAVSKSPEDNERSRKPVSSKSESTIVKSDIQRCKTNNDEDDDKDNKNGKEKTFAVVNKNVEKMNSVLKSDNEQSAVGVDNVVSTIDDDHNDDDKNKKKKNKNKKKNKISSTTDKKIDSTIDSTENKIKSDVNKNVESYNDDDDDENEKDKVRTEKPQSKHKEIKSSFVEHRLEDTTSGFIVERMVYVSADERDFKPRGAVISLALGLTTTALMAALIACRLRVVRRRGRRGHGPYAHDADYLVNGMYL